MRLSGLFENYINNASVGYFIIDSGKHEGDRDFETYTWKRSINNQINEDDLFIYRKSQKASTTGKFYLFGCGRFGRIQGDDLVNAEILDPQEFESPIMQYDLVDFSWNSKQKGKSWEHFWNQYGINRISKVDFINLLNIVDGDYYSIDFGTKVIEHEVQMAQGNYFVADHEAVVKSRPWQAAWSKGVKENFGYKCAICGISTSSLLVGSHIMPVSVDKDNRLNPSNGFCLCVLHDKLFDKGLITIMPNMTVAVTRLVHDEVLSKLLDQLKGTDIKRPYINSIDEKFLEYHRNNIFQK
jgi:putative restriction endonuclease